MSEELTPLTRKELFLSAASGEGECPDPVTRIEMFLSAAAGEGECPEPVTRLEEFLAAAAGQGEAPDPVTRVEMFLAAISGKGEAPEPVTRLEMFLAGWAAGGGGAIKTLTGNAPLTFEALAAALVSLTQDGKTVQDGTPTPDAPVDIVCNNGTLKMRHRSGLPTGYKLLEYVGGSGSQYVITDTYLASTDVIECEYRNSSTTGYGAIYGIYKTGESTALYGNQTYYGYDQANNKVDTGMSVDTDWHSSRHDFVNGTLTIDNTTTTFTPWTFTNDTKNAVLSRFYNGSYGYNWRGYVRKFKVTRGNEVICDLLPAKNSSNVAGLYDLISGNFYTATGGTLLEGNEVDDYELVVDGTPEVLSVGGVNLFDPAYYTGGGWYIASSNQVAEAGSNGTLVFPCKPNTTYSWWHTDGKGGQRAFELTTDTVTVGQAATWAIGNPAYNDAMTVRKYTTSANAKLLCVLFARVADQVGRTIDEQLADFMLVEGDIEEAFAYEPYRTPQTASVADLYAVGDYKDTHELIGGVVKRNVGIKVLDGTESGWALSDSGSTHRFRGVKPTDSRTPASRAPIVSTHFVYVSAGQTLGGAFIGASQYWYFIPTDQTIDTADAWTAWLAAQYDNGTPVIVIYPLATETTESVQGQALRTEKGGNAISVVSNVDPVALTVEYKGAKE